MPTPLTELRPKERALLSSSKNFLFFFLLQVVRLRAKHTEGFDPRCFARAKAAAVWSRPVAFAPQPWALEVTRQLLGSCVPA